MTAINPTHLFMEPIAVDGANAPREVESRDPAKHGAEWGEKGYAKSFRYYEQDILEVNGQELKGEKRYDAGEYYLGDSIATVKEAANSITSDGQRENFEFNASQQNAEFAVMRSGRAVAFLSDNDHVVTTAGAILSVSDHAADEAMKI